MSEPGDLIYCCRECVARLKPKYVDELCRYIEQLNEDTCHTCGKTTRELSECNQVHSEFVTQLELSQR
jgi:hypothetical protein